MKHAGSKEELHHALAIQGKQSFINMRESQISLPTLRNCSMKFLKDIHRGKKQYILQQIVVTIKVPTCPELTVDKVLQQVKPHREIMKYLPEPSVTGKHYVERDFLFCVVNTIDRNYFREALAEIELRRQKNGEGADG